MLPSTRLRRLDEQHAASRACPSRDTRVCRTSLAELGDLARHLDAGRAGADDDERQPRLRAAASSCSTSAASNASRIRSRRSSAPSSVFSSGACARPVVVAEVRVARPAGDDEHVVVELLPRAPFGRSVDRRRARASRSNPVDLAEHDPRVALPPQDLAQRDGDLDGGERARRDLVGERLEEDRSSGGRRASPRRRRARSPRTASSPPNPPPTTTTRCHYASIAPSSWSRRASRRGRPRSPVSEPFAPMMRWQGSTIGIGLRFITVPTARAALGRPTFAASAP